MQHHILNYQIFGMESWVQHFAMVSCWTFRIPNYPCTIQLTLCKKKMYTLPRHHTQIVYLYKCSNTFKHIHAKWITHTLGRVLQNNFALLPHQKAEWITHSKQSLTKQVHSIASLQNMNFSPKHWHIVRFFQQNFKYQQLRYERPITL